MLRLNRGVLRQEEGESEGGGQGELFQKDNERLARLEKGVQDTQQAVSTLAGFFQRPQVQQQRQAPADDPRKRIEEQFFANPAGTTAQMAQYAAAQQVNQVRAELYPMQVRAARDSARGQDPEIFDKYREDVENWVRSVYGPEHHNNEFVWGQALNAVKASKLDEIAAFKAEKKKAAAALNAPSRRGVGAEEQQGLSDDEREAAQFLGFSDAKYEAVRKRYREDQKVPFEGRKMVDSSWGNVITLDSRNPRKRTNA